MDQKFTMVLSKGCYVASVSDAESVLKRGRKCGSLAEQCDVCLPPEDRLGYGLRYQCVLTNSRIWDATRGSIGFGSTISFPSILCDAGSRMKR